MQNEPETAQNYQNHRKFVVAFHAVVSTLLVLGLIFSIVALVKAFGDAGIPWTELSLVALALGTSILMWYARSFPVGVQDRVIRLEESLRAQALTGKPLDPTLTMSQVIALRFASDEEYATLATRAVTEKLTNDQIKKAVKNWRADNARI